MLARHRPDVRLWVVGRASAGWSGRTRHCQHGLDGAAVKPGGQDGSGGGSDGGSARMLKIDSAVHQGMPPRRLQIACIATGWRAARKQQVPSTVRTTERQPFLPHPARLSRWLRWRCSQPCRTSTNNRRGSAGKEIHVVTAPLATQTRRLKSLRTSARRPPHAQLAKAARNAATAEPDQHSRKAD